MVGYITHGNIRNLSKILIGKRERDNLECLGIGGDEWLGVKMDLKEIRWDGLDWIELAEDRVQ
jgi:hypothetical protein